jgi:hypothetical protein
MMKYFFFLFILVVLLQSALAQTPVDSNLLAVIDQIQAIDNHCHDEGMPARKCGQRPPSPTHKFLSGSSGNDG